MKLTTTMIALAGALLLFASPAFAAASAPPADTMALTAPIATPAEHDVHVCPLAIVEDSTTCQFAVMADAASCGPDMAPTLATFGVRLLASADFLANCLGRPSPDTGPPS